ncbi:MULTISPECIES: D-aminoacyl-tRNA deacylase [Fusobacterium]|jgi:D-tyrosyl-tRNA(Tyr) deacylase|uniref:D-aminoacyl-tRNA deacylase n=1 Tax=Fusobacterium varium ATCC 27725 TaxID=469618 RepID=A0ABM6U0V7_FUSVA|nr:MULTISPECIES: D-aminoacyl-tRNA deacylase [Fusobacterium]AVQ29925.1 D-tyrosyl-tRNA(Tyr) deacylase [Fusobacterium varium ATCC 27725]EES65214.1 D-tyrosyl-tRNA(Tyr) deacylase [Fusobacterium varium ATCC 27725]MCD7979080.1 D-tyrosyl-tRNA(Tyr) deacylase [Fusobacterium sp.]MCF0170660.1 D-tyrosyl-tRNA(Tyr) deacylase [Fusobacterium varium]MCF2672953.1 D-tyrosyl-tRNA(Tyr) deacylase [Fusobacterium varium]
MRAVIQRVKHSSVTVDGNILGEIGNGLLVLLGVTHTDTEKEVNWLAAKVKDLRIFEDEEGKMNLGLEDIKGELLVISQFTLYGNCIKGRRPGFTEAARPDLAEPLYEKFLEKCRSFGIKTECGKFGADMKVELLNDGPVTMIIDTKDIANLK